MKIISGISGNWGFLEMESLAGYFYTERSYSWLRQVGKF